ncbi:MAG TPA: glycine/sarcosine/betaine reductase component B subunit [Methylomirabilota bacterium]|nr:glycine/sarcosine/betaine reductase component B subunit [Methylomirabilota bacterium]
MKLTLETFAVNALELGSRTAFVGGTLSLDRDELIRLAHDERAFARVELELVAPGEATRIIHVLDAVEPRVKVGGDTVTFPGFLGPARTVGAGVTRRLGGMAVLECGTLPEPTGGILEFNEGLIDMTGPGAAYCACSTTHNVVLSFTARPGVTNRDYETAIRLGTLRVCRRLAETTLSAASPDSVEELGLGDADPALPRIAYADQVQQQGFLVQTYLYGQPVDSLVPTVLHPNEYFDGAVVSGNYRSMMKTPTWLRLNHPVIRALYRRHGKELNFVGVVFGRGHHGDHETKERNGYMMANVARMLGAQGVVQTLEGTGNTWVDFMQSVRGLERAGIRTVQIVHELGGAEGKDWPIVDYVPEADAIVSGGGADRRFTLPTMKRVVGGTEVVFSSNEGWGRPLNPADSLTVSAHEMYAGFWMMQTNGFSARDV